MERSTTPEVVVHDSKSTDLIKPTSPTSEKAPGAATQGQYNSVNFNEGSYGYRGKVLAQKEFVF